ncbi:hypothetical protein [Saccharothrix australiensis]|uniref:Mce-associated membrane protein n=1 Tax=Saccharothrix australiensis TaxID=2072 RepID=A0A495WAE9_9PSEU|nr:hypothetical protein [Saccharothrix australiensis]RKT56778.1 hypothetical protein C8E97_5489 [Saccharothrix australiensis]
MPALTVPALTVLALTVPALLSACAPSARDDAPPAPTGVADRISGLRAEPVDGATAEDATRAADAYVELFESTIAAPPAEVPASFSDVAAGAALARVAEQIGVMHRNGLAARGRTDPAFDVVGRSGDTVYVTSCTPEGRIGIVHVGTGAPAERAGDDFAVVLFGLRLDGGRWKVSEVETFTVVDCPTPSGGSAAY